jgi:hypothetical protein
MKKKPRVRTAILAAFVATAAVTALAIFEPAIAAIACPICYGFARVEKNTFIDRNASTEQRDYARTVIGEARQRVSAFFGRQESTPALFVCTTDECYARVGGGASHRQAILDVGLFLSSRSFTPAIAAYELSHIELHKRLGRLKTMEHDIPRWFDEGVAVIVSRDPRYPLAENDRQCAAAMQGEMPTSRMAWVEDPAHDRLYAKAEQRIGCWMSHRGGPSAVIALIAKVASGISFADAYR